MKYVLILLLLLSQHTSAPPVKQDKSVTLGYYVGDISYDSLVSSSDKLDMVAMASYDINKKGDVVLRSDDPTKAVKIANEKGIQTYALFSNPEFDSNIAHVILTRSNLQKKAIQSMINTAVRQGYQGINLDFEGLQPSDRDHYTAFVAKTAIEARKHGLKIIVSVPPKSSDCLTCVWNGAFDYKKLGEIADYVQVMTYDEHGPADIPGSVASYAWIEEILAYVVSVVPSHKVLMGIPAYGYDWNLKYNEQSVGIAGKQYWNTPSRLDEASISSTVHYEDEQGSPHVVWFENAQGVEAKSALVQKYQLAGVSVWRLGHESSDFWNYIKIN